METETRVRSTKGPVHRNELFAALNGFKKRIYKEKEIFAYLIK